METNNNHQQSWSTPRKGGGGCLKGLIALLIVVVLGCTMVFTCPDRKAHEQAILDSTKGWVNMKVDQQGMGAILGEFIKWLGGQGADLAIDQYLEVDNYFVCSVGKLNVGEKPKWVSLGVMNHVFTFGKDDVEQALTQAHEEEVARIEAQSKELMPDSVAGVSMAPAKELLDSLAAGFKREAVNAARDWAHRQIDKLGRKNDH